MVEDIEELLKKFEPASPPISKSAHMQTISNDGVNSGDHCISHLLEKRPKNRPYVLGGTKLNKGLPLYAPTVR